MAKITFTSKQLDEFGVPQDWDQLDEYVNRVEVIKDELIDSYKYIQTHEVIFRLDENFYKCYYYTEHNEGMSWNRYFDRGDDAVECIEVEAKPVTVITYVEKT
jgi:hypothetical protein